jgi:hypothetical protein
MEECKGWVADRDVLNNFFGGRKATPASAEEELWSGGTPLWGDAAHRSPEGHDGKTRLPRRLRVQHTVFQLHSFACGMAARSSCYAAAVVGRNLKAGGCPLFCVLPPPPSPLAPPRQNPQPAKCPCCPARLPKMQKDQAAPIAPHLPDPHPAERSHNASGSVLSSSRVRQQSLLCFCPLCLPVSANNAFAFFLIPRACHQHMQK